jgi:hypothetical protein
LARMEIRIFIETLLSRIGQFRVPSGARLQYASGQTRGLASMSIEFDPLRSDPEEIAGPSSKSRRCMSSRPVNVRRSE